MESSRASLKYQLDVHIRLHAKYVGEQAIWRDSLAQLILLHYAITKASLFVCYYLLIVVMIIFASEHLLRTSFSPK